MVAPGHVAHGLLADVLVVDAAQEVMQQPFAQGAVGDAHALQPQGFEDGREDRHAAGEHRRPFAADGGEIQPFQVPGFDQAPFKMGKAGAGDLAPPQLRFYDAVDGEGRAGGTDGVVPAARPVDAFDHFEFLAGGALRGGQPLGVDTAIAEMRGR